MSQNPNDFVGPKGFDGRNGFHGVFIGDDTFSGGQINQEPKSIVVKFYLPGLTPLEVFTQTSDAPDGPLFRNFIAPIVAQNVGGNVVPVGSLVYVLCDDSENPNVRKINAATLVAIPDGSFATKYTLMTTIT